MKTKPYERIMPKDDFNISEYFTAEEIAVILATVSTAACVPEYAPCSQDWNTDGYNSRLLSFEL